MASKKIKVHCIADMHGKYKSLIIPECDLLLIAGDILPLKFGPNNRYFEAKTQYDHFYSDFLPWLKKQPFKECAFVWGNHDFIGEEFDFLKESLPNNIHFLSDSYKNIIINNVNIKIYGTPYTLWFHDWAFNSPIEDTIDAFEPFMTEKFELCPNDCRIIISHGPPRGHLDKTNDGRSTGSYALTDKINSVKPDLVVVGHIHQSSGFKNLDKTIICNAAVMNEKREIVNNGYSFELNIEG